jgi:thermostable 8-oxoguanine DNA glycosylase
MPAPIKMKPAMIEELQQSYLVKRPAICARLAEFAEIGRRGDDALLFEELAYCIFTAGASARMGLNSLARVRKHLLKGRPRNA